MSNERVLTKGDILHIVTHNQKLKGTVSRVFVRKSVVRTNEQRTNEQRSFEFRVSADNGFNGEGLRYLTVSERGYSNYSTVMGFTIEADADVELRKRKLENARYTLCRWIEDRSTSIDLIEAVLEIKTSSEASKKQTSETH